ncbi:tetratricopeptide repeat protein [Armatimonas sp.]|uniref:tetratricopeptide repeat protein n=1 Tax=Armatimonas sp. TaxID=1872638 RepID=UPI0037510886
MKKKKSSLPMRPIAPLPVPNLRTESDETLVNVPDGITIFSFTVTYDAIEDEYATRVPDGDRDKIHKLAFGRTSPRKKIPLLKEWIERYPNFPRLYNFLSAAYVAAKDYPSAEALVRETYERFPEYLFARINYADILLRNDREDEVAALFPEGWALPMIFPNRSTFHATEVTGLAGLAARYFLRQDDGDQAMIHIQTLLKVGGKKDPALPAILSELLDYRLRNDFEKDKLSALTAKLPLGRLLTGR